ncbi:MAG: TraB/GumN family protein [Bacteroidota bacterium]
MRAFLLSCLLLLVLCGCNRSVATAQTEPTSVAPAYAPTQSDTSLLWKISAPGNATPSYLFGTIHLIPAEDYFVPNGVLAALDESEEVLFEIDPRAMQDPSMLFSLMSKINMRGDTTLEDLLTKEEFATVKGYFTKTGLPFMIFQRMKPLFLSAMVGQDLSAMAGGGGNPMDNMKSYEFELSAVAEAGGKEISGLETMEFQLSLFDSIPYGAQALMLHDAIVKDEAGESGTGESELDMMVRLYKSKSVAAMASTISDASAKVAHFEELLLTKRNANWAPVIESAVRVKDAGARFYAVGAGHLGGEKGVIALLRKAGLTVEPVY